MTHVVPVRTSNVSLALAALLALAGTAVGQDLDVERALRRYDPSLRPEEGFVLRGDFDGDGDDDLATVAVDDGGRRSLVVLQADRGDWRVHPLYARLPDGPLELRLVPPGTYRVLATPGMVELGAPGVELAFPGRSSALYAWVKGKWQVYGTENY